MLRGLTTVNHFAADVPAAVRWYTEVFGVPPYFEKDFAGQLAYVEFRIGDYQHEFGILDSRYAPHPISEQPSGAMTYWAVDDVEDAFTRLLALGATEHAKPTEHGPGFVTASVVDPFGNVLGVMFNQHYLDMVRLIKGE
ncbi:VOC family protein [Nocardia otitidiscaviarum]|uniref:VOC family protein n=1 Tax=Nocardia otitidiscaviarum TaxID=1823 RepID=UPI0004A7460F|nr:VOC family protein [Nocardia otitidiscaviarum]MBF6135501.1 VOC family protein [Nocardia otitidiscaviarum]MBF6487318.1 VOC family protein [Nocardia otitidiscaviarum]